MSKFYFRSGDRITIECKGLETKSDDKSKQVAINSDSIQKYGKKQYPAINNRFLTRKLSQQIANKIRTDWCFPKKVFTVVVPLKTYFNIVGTSNLMKVNFRSQQLLPYREGYQEACRITSIEHNVKGGTTKLTLVADNFY